MANVFEQVDVKNKVSRNGFDLSEDVQFTARVGEILPVFCKVVMPGDNVKLYPQHFSRTMPLNTSAYTRIKEQVNFFKVRFHLLHNQFDTFITHMYDNPQQATGMGTSPSFNDNIPYITEKDIYDFLFALKANGNIATDELGYNCLPRMIKLLQYLGYGDYSSVLTSSSAPSGYFRKLSPFPLLAYQKVYYDYFRYQQWENSSPWCFNINYASFGTPLDLSKLSNSSSQLWRDCMFTLRYANFPKDYFLGVLPSSQYGDTSVVPIVSPENTSISPTVLNSVNSFPSSIGNIIGSVSNNHLGVAIRSIVSNPSILAIRKAEALQKLKEIQQSGDQDYKSQIEKIFNVNISDLESDLCEWLGGYSSYIDISEVVNTNVGVETANIKGKGVGSGQKEIEFESKDFSIIIGVYTAVPELTYNVKAPASHTQLVNYYDYPNPVLDKVGMDGLPAADILPPSQLTSSLLSSYLGYVPRYWKFKSSYNRVLGGFSEPDYQLSSWVAPFNKFSSRFIAFGQFTYKMFKVDPSILNSIMSVQIGVSLDNTMSAYYDEEQLLVNMSIGCPMVRPLDFNGLPY